MTRKAFVIGHPIAHSRSPLIHGSWLKAYGIDGSYEAIDVAPEALPDFIARLRMGELLGGNVTIPHKETVFALCDEVDPLARIIGAVNTLVGEGGRVRGFNTDYMGFLGNLDQNAPGWSDNLGEAVVFGAGGAARAILVALQQRGVRVIHLLNRTLASAEAMATAIGGDIRPAPIDRFTSVAPGSGLLVNTTSVGMHGTRFAGLAIEALPATALVTDIVYVPLVTPLLADARAVGLRTVDGLGMLLHQAVPGFEAWFGVRPSVTADLRATIERTL